MIVTVFRSRLLPGGKEEYLALAERMNKLATTMTGYIAHKSFFADDGERVTIVEFESQDALQAWRVHPDHVEAQRQGRSRFYSEYRTTTCEVLYHSAFTREKAA
jgi:heme-degrading monooxygenase HmoA